MAAVNSVGNALTGSTGTGTFVGANTPTLITPVLGAATATSVNFGGSTLSTYSANTSWTPTFTFTVLGDLSVSYATRLGNYSRIGNLVMISFNVTCTPTFTTASGGARLSGIPFNGTSATQGVGMVFPAGFNFPTAAVEFLGYIGPSYSTIDFYGVTAVGGNPQSVSTNFTSGVQISLVGTITYLV